MAKFRPSLLDTLLAGSRASAEDPEVQSETLFPGLRLYSLDRMSETSFLDTLRRDLSWLLNTVRLEETDDLSAAPEVARSVVNFGIPDFAVRTYAQVNVFEAAATLAGTIRTFEPRIDPRSLSVRGEKTMRDDVVQALVFHIACNVGQDQDPLRAGFKTEIDVETGDARLEQRR
ncbi:MAG: type VI secretion system baseplate subunit TssE [Alphaproteobacteria bacterium]|nr:type VI secretion system baseplate subunit TssE [Alphaproteobacteria bacterium]